jgi:hypothetical protein
MGYFLKSHIKSYEIKNSFEPGPIKDALQFDNKEAARKFLIQLLQDPTDMYILRQLVYESTVAGACFRLDDREVIDTLAWGLVIREVLIIPHEHPIYEGPGIDDSAGSAESPPPLEPGIPLTPRPETAIPGTETHWISFQVINEKTETPIQGVELTVQLPDGTIQSYTSDSSGNIYIGNLPDGSCDIQKLKYGHAVEVVEVLQDQ